MTEYPIDVRLTQHSRRGEVDLTKLAFGQVFSDHMFIADYADGAWRDARIVPYGPIPMSPSLMALHYGQAIFEGMKANKHVKTGEPLLFRPEVHLDRFNKSAERMAMPTLPADLFIGALERLVAIDRQWIPEHEGSALYLRPVLFASDEFLGVRASNQYKFVVMTCPVGPYYPKPIRVRMAHTHVRAFPGGVGFAKAAGNYGAALYPTNRAKEEGFDQILWLDGKEFKYLQECGTMNIMVVIDDTVVTPPTTDTILAGITRDSLLTLMRHKGIRVEERPVTVDELIDAHRAGRLREMFGTGTAAVVSQVAEWSHKGILYPMPPTDEAKIAPAMKKLLEDYKHGAVEDLFGWLHPIAVPASV